jgi:hypothetical protein
MEHPADAAALGLELEAIDIENDLEWAEAQGRSGDAALLERALAGKLYELADAVDRALEQPAPAIRAPHAA